MRDGQAVRLRGQAVAPLHAGRAVPEGEPLPRPRPPPRPAPPPARAHRAEGDRHLRTSVLGRRARPDRRGAGDRCLDEHGPAALLPFGYAGNQGILQCRTMSERLFNALGASNVVGGLCGNTAEAGLRATQGTGIGIDPEDLRHARVILLWSTNTLVTNRHLWPILEEARAAGARVICIDPLRTRTAAACDEHVQLLPGTDAALALGMMHVLVARDLVDHAYVAAHAVGYDELVDARPRVAARAGRGGVRPRRPSTIERLAVAYGEGEPSRHPRPHRHGAPRERRHGLPHDQLPAGPHGRVAASRRRPRAQRRPALRRGAPPRRAAPARPAPARPPPDRDGQARGGPHGAPGRRGGPLALRLQLQPGGDHPQPGQGAGGPGPRGPVHRRARAVHDRHRSLRRRDPPGHHADRAPRPHAGVGPPLPHAQPPGDRPARRGAAQHGDLPAPRLGARAWTTPRCAQPTRSSSASSSTAPSTRSWPASRSIGSGRRARSGSGGPTTGAPTPRVASPRRAARRSWSR